MTTKSRDLVKLDLWYTSIYELGKTGVNLLDYQDMSEIFESHIEFKPRSLEKRFVKDGQNANCLTDHLYCAVQPSGSDLYENGSFMIGEDTITPDEIVNQNLRELCVHDSLFPLFKSHWFRYMHDLMEKCLIVEVGGNKKLAKITEECHDEVI